MRPLDRLDAILIALAILTALFALALLDTMRAAGVTD